MGGFRTGHGEGLSVWWFICVIGLCCGCACEYCALFLCPCPCLCVLLCADSSAGLSCALKCRYLHNNQIASLPAGVFDHLTNLIWL